MTVPADALAHNDASPSAERVMITKSLKVSEANYNQISKKGHEVSWNVAVVFGSKTICLKPMNKSWFEIPERTP